MENCSNKNKMQSGGVLGGVYFSTIVGAAIYFLQGAATFWGVVFAILKALVWPAFVVYKVLELLKL